MNKPMTAFEQQYPEQARKIEYLEATIAARFDAKHYGPYGAVCMNTGQFDAGECWLCYAKRKKKRIEELEAVVIQAAQMTTEWQVRDVLDQAGLAYAFLALDKEGNG